MRCAHVIHTSYSGRKSGGRTGKRGGKRGVGERLVGWWIGWLVESFRSQSWRVPVVHIYKGAPEMEGSGEVGWVEECGYDDLRG